MTIGGIFVKVIRFNSKQILAHRNQINRVDIFIVINITQYKAVA